MATFSSLGIGSGMDLNSLVAQLVAAERGPKQQQITSQQSQAAIEISALGSLKGALGAFQTALTPLKTGSFDLFSAKSGDEEVFTATATASAPLGHYDVRVIQLAKSQQLSSTPFASGDESVGTGSLTLAVGEDSFTIEIDEDSSTVEGIRDAINRAEDNTGIRATVVNGTDGAHLVLTSEQTGEDHAITVSAAGSGLDRLAYSAEATANYTEVRAAQNALIELAGSEHSSSSNTIKDAIEGVTLKLLKEDPENSLSLNIDRNRDSISTRIKSFVTQYNSLAGTMANLQSYNATTEKAGALLGDSMLRNVESSLRRELTRPVDGASGTYATLSSLGISMDVNGKLELDDAKLRDALDTDFAAVERIFSSAGGVATRMDEILKPHLSADGSIAQRNKSLDARSKRLEDDQMALDARMKIVEQRYAKQFTALDSLLAQLQSTSGYLSQQLANLPKIGG